MITARGRYIQLQYIFAMISKIVILHRNADLLRGGFQPPKTVKTGTTIVGIIFKDGVILGADTRATEGPIVSDKNCSKIHYLAKNM